MMNGSLKTLWRFDMSTRYEANKEYYINNAKRYYLENKNEETIREYIKNRKC